MENKDNEVDILEIPKTSQFESDMARYKAFREVFLGTELGTKVFKEILGMGYMMNNTEKYSTGGVDVHATLITTGERKFALKIHSTTMKEPQVQPPKMQTRKRR